MICVMPGHTNTGVTGKFTILIMVLVSQVSTYVRLSTLNMYCLYYVNYVSIKL